MMVQGICTTYYAEIFVIDYQGAIVVMTNKTSDYWQGDELKFEKAFNQGQGQVFVGDVSGTTVQIPFWFRFQSL